LPTPKETETSKEEPKEVSTEIPNVLKRFFKEAPKHDIKFEVESQLIPAHKWWLSNRSKYFANMFSSISCFLSLNEKN